MTATTELFDWLNGTPSGGPFGDGRYPMTYKDGVVHYILCPAAVALSPDVYPVPLVFGYAGAAPDGQVGVPFSYAYSINNGVPPFTRTVNAIPNGLSAAINESLLEISGDPSYAETGAFVNITVQDAVGRTFTVADSINIAPYDVTNLFTASEPGVWLDPSDFERYISLKGSELFSYAAMTTIGVAPVVNEGAGTVRFQGAAGFRIIAPLNGYYELSFDLVDNTAPGTTTNEIKPSVSGGSAWDGGFIKANGRYVLRFNSGAGNDWRIVARSATTDITLSNISMKQLTGLGNATLFQDSAGTTPVTAMEQPVGLVLDKRLGLVRGPEKFTGGDGASGFTGLTTTGTWSINGSNQFVCTVNGNLEVTVPPLTVGKTYEIGLDIIGTNTNTINLMCGTGTVIPLTLGKSGRYYARVPCATNGRLIVQVTGAPQTIANITAKELPGNHASQATTAMKPLLSARKNMMLNTENPAAWGSSENYTISADDGAGGRLFTTNATSNLSVGSSSGYTIGSSWTTQNTFMRVVEVKKGSARYVRWGSSAAGGILIVDLDTLLPVYTGAALTVTITEMENGWVQIASAHVGDDASWLASELSTTLRWSTGWTSGSVLDTAGEIGSSLRVRRPRFAVNGVGDLTIPRYQRVTTATDYDTVGFPLYLKGDGVDDFLEAKGWLNGVGNYAAMAAQVDNLTGNTSNGDTLYLNDGSPNGIGWRASGGTVRQLATRARVGGGTLFSADAVGASAAFDVGTPFVTDGWHTGTVLGAWASKNPVEQTVAADTLGATNLVASSRLMLNDAASRFYGGVMMGRAPTATERGYVRSYLNSLID